MLIKFSHFKDQKTPFDDKNQKLRIFFLDFLHEPVFGKLASTYKDVVKSQICLVSMFLQ